MKRILCQGDSITDAERSRTNDEYRGSGYATMVMGSLGMERPGEFEFVNRGIGGNWITNLLARVKRNIIHLAPDYMSILIGVNDVWGEYPDQNGVDHVRYENFYNMLIEQVKEALPNIKIMILKPYALKGSGTEKYWQEIRSGVEKRADAAKRVAEKNQILFVPLMKKFDEALNTAPVEYWLYDGVHPTAMGHELIKREWLKAFEKLEKQ